MITPFAVDETGVPEISRCAYEKQALPHKKKNILSKKSLLLGGAEQSLLVIREKAMPPF